jgi:hypothetical protein
MQLVIAGIVSIVLIIMGILVLVNDKFKKIVAGTVIGIGALALLGSGGYGAYKYQKSKAMMVSNYIPPQMEYLAPQQRPMMPPPPQRPIPPPPQQRPMMPPPQQQLYSQQ